MFLKIGNNEVFEIRSDGVGPLTNLKLDNNEKLYFLDSNSSIASAGYIGQSSSNDLEFGVGNDIYARLNSKGFMFVNNPLTGGDATTGDLKLT